MELDTKPLVTAKLNLTQQILLVHTLNSTSNNSIKILEDENLYRLESDYGLKIDDSREERRSIRFDFSGDKLKKFAENEIDCAIITAKQLLYLI